jgi:hypothetical protein
VSAGARQAALSWSARRASSAWAAEGGKALAEALRVNAALTSLDLSYNCLCGVDKDGDGTYDGSGIKALASALEVNAVLKKCDVSYNRMDEDAKAVLREAVKGREGLELIL